MMTTPSPLPPLPSERLLIEAIDAATCERCIVASPGRGQAGWHVRGLAPQSSVVCWYVDSFRASAAQDAATEAGVDVEIVCSSDLPETTVQLALLPILQRGEAEMTRDLLQQAHERLELGGVLMASVNHPHDRWLLQQMQALFPKVTCEQSTDGWVYSGIKRQPLKKRRRFDAEFVFRDGERLLRAVTRPSVFSHRSLDVAARHLIAQGDVQPGERVLDLGCGSGAVALAAAARSASGDVFAVDSNARAVACARRGAELNGLTNVNAILNHDGVLSDIPPCDVALLNPPYYGDFSIARHFLATATRYLRAGGRLVVVTKQRESYVDHLWPSLALADEVEAGGYQLLTYLKRAN